MTTIAYRDGIVAADRLVTINGSVRGLTHCRKLYQKKHYGVMFGATWTYGLAGETAYTEQLWKILAPLEAKEHDQHEESHEFQEFMKLAVDAEGDYRITAFRISNERRFQKLQRFGFVDMTLPQGFFAIGSGERYALGAMAAGASAEEAVRCAAIFDGGTSLEVDIMHISGREISQEIRND